MHINKEYGRFSEINTRVYKEGTQEGVFNSLAETETRAPVGRLYLDARHWTKTTCAPGCFCCWLSRCLSLLNAATVTCTFFMIGRRTSPQKNSSKRLHVCVFKVFLRPPAHWMMVNNSNLPSMLFVAVSCCLLFQPPVLGNYTRVKLQWGPQGRATACVTVKVGYTHIWGSENVSASLDSFIHLFF